jgi:hypothetical protein
MGNAVDGLDEVVPAMVEGLRPAGDTSEILWFEEDAARFQTLSELLGNEPGVTLTTRVLESEEPAGPPRETPTTILDVREDGGELIVSILVPRGNGIVPSRRSKLSPEQRLALVGGPKDRAPNESVLRRHGRALAELLFGHQAPAVLDACRGSRIVVVHDAASSGLPYEALSDVGSKGKTVTPATSGGVVRRLQVSDVGLDEGLGRPPHIGRLNVLLVVNPTKDLAGADAEADAVCEQLQSTGVNFAELRHEEATAEAVLKALGDPAVDILHYCGHAFFDGPGETESGLNCADGPLTLADLRQLQHVPRVAFVNACQAGRVRAPGTDVPRAQAFAEFFLRAGITAYLGTFWLVSDAGAASFATTLYRELGAGRRLGEAVISGRNELRDLRNSDWANYLLYGDSSFVLVRSPSGENA